MIAHAHTIELTPKNRGPGTRLSPSLPVSSGTIT